MCNGKKGKQGEGEKNERCQQSRLGLCRDAFSRGNLISLLGKFVDVSKSVSQPVRQTVMTSGQW